MRRVFSVVCKALSDLRHGGHPLLKRGPAIELYGTSRGWREGQRKDLTEVAAENNIADL